MPPKTKKTSFEGLEEESKVASLEGELQTQPDGGIGKPNKSAPRPKGTKKQKTEEDKEGNEAAGQSTKATANMEGNEDSVPATKAPKKRRNQKKTEDSLMKASLGLGQDQELDEEMKQAMLIAAQADGEEGSGEDEVQQNA